MTNPIRPPLRVIAAVEIKGIRLVEASVRTRIRSSNDVGQARLLLDWSARLKKIQGSGAFLVTPTIDARIVPEGQEGEPAVWVRAVYELTYSLPQGFSATRSELNTFAQTNGVFNVWPYWREFVQSMFVRMNLPPLVLPVFRLAEHPPRQLKKASRRSPAGKPQREPASTGS